MSVTKKCIYSILDNTFPMPVRRAELHYVRTVPTYMSKYSGLDPSFSSRSSSAYPLRLHRYQCSFVLCSDPNLLRNEKEQKIRNLMVGK